MLIAPGGNGARREGMDGTRPPGFDAAPNEGDPMADELPSNATFYVAHAVANHVLIQLAEAIAAYLAISAPDDRERSGRDLLHEVLSRFMPSAEFKPQRIADTLAPFGPYDADEAESMAMEIVGNAIVAMRQKFNL